MGTIRKPSRSPYHHIVLRRFDGSQANVSSKTKDKDAAALMSHHSQLLVDASCGKPVPINECLETAEAICKAVNRKRRSPTPAIPYLQGMMGGTYRVRHILPNQMSRNRDLQTRPR